MSPFTQHTFSTSGWVAAAAFAAAICGVISPSRAEAPRDHKLGFVMTSLFTAVYETKYMEECPDGLSVSNDELWWKNLRPKERDRLTHSGDDEPISETRRSVAALRGPNGLDVCWNPTIIKDPPMVTVEGKISYGVNLDGTADGSATATTCAHEKFNDPAGEVGIDNQLYRLLGCTYGWRSNGYMELNANTERRDSSHGIILLEVTGVDDLQNDDDVQVGFYRNLDALPKDSTGRILPYASYRADDKQRYGAIAHGRIVNGVLMTDPVDAHLPFYGLAVEMDMYIRDMRLKLPILGPGDARKGVIAGYHDLNNFWSYIQKIGSGYAVTAQISCPALYEAAHRLADGHKDPMTGQCTALSSAYHIDVVPAFIVHPSSRTAMSSGSGR